MYEYKATFVRVIDGDTVVMNVDLGFYISMRDIHFRLAGINAPERGKEGAAEATEYVRDFFAKNPVVTIDCYGQDKYGRWLAVIDAPSGGTLNKDLIDKGLAVEYMTLL